MIRLFSALFVLGSLFNFSSLFPLVFDLFRVFLIPSLCINMRSFNDLDKQNPCIGKFLIWPETSVCHAASRILTHIVSAKKTTVAVPTDILIRRRILEYNISQSLLGRLPETIRRLTDRGCFPMTRLNIPLISDSWSIWETFGQPQC